MTTETKQIVQTALLSAVICVLSPLSIPLGSAVPISLATLGVMLAGALCGKMKGTLAVLIYIIIGMIGLPVFAGYSAGVHVVFGMTGGYIIGYLPLAYVTGLFIEKSKTVPMCFSGMILGTLILYTIGTIWFLFFTEMELGAALAVCVLPFLPGDFLKMVLVVILVKRLEPVISRM